MQKTIHLFSSKQQLAKACASEFASLIQASTKPLHVALSGGRSPIAFYHEFLQQDIDWNRVCFYFSDERCVPPEHEDSNFGKAKEAFLQHIPSQYHRMKAEKHADKEYEELLRDNLPQNQDGIPSFDILFLGLGTDGHTASLFPGTDALQEQERLVVINQVPQLESTRMTFTLPLINAAKQVWILACGSSKQPVLPDALLQQTDFVIDQVRPKGKLVWWLDQKALEKS